MESPGTAPGSEPLITQGFITIVPKNAFKIRGSTANEKAIREDFPNGLFLSFKTGLLLLRNPQV